MCGPSWGLILHQTSVYHDHDDGDDDDDQVGLIQARQRKGTSSCTTMFLPEQSSLIIAAKKQYGLHTDYKIT